MQSASPDLPPVIQRLRSFPKDKPRNVPAGNRNTKLTKALADRFFSLLAESDKSIPHILRENPDLPPFKTLFNWQERVPWFREAWKRARLRQTHFLADRCLDLYNQAEPKTAHVIRIKFDVLKWLAAKFNPTDYGDKPLPSQQSTVVNVGVSIDPQRLSDLRTKLDQSRFALLPRPSKPENESRTLNGHSERQPNTVVSSETRKANQDRNPDTSQ